jgi:hypothetical protein
MYAAAATAAAAAAAAGGISQDDDNEYDAVDDANNIISKTWIDNVCISCASVTCCAPCSRTPTLRSALQRYQHAFCIRALPPLTAPAGDTFEQCAQDVRAGFDTGFASLFL